MDGIVGADVRSAIAEAFNYILNAYLDGRIDDEQLKRDLVEFCLDVLVVKKPFEDLGKLREEAEDWAEKLYRAVRTYTLRQRLFMRYGLGE
jgi:undecaprenyl pyrophosphate synthase